MRARRERSRYHRDMDDVQASPETTDESLMLAYAAGEAGAFDRLYHRHRDRLYRFLYRQLNADPVVDELFQDVWSRVIRARSTFQTGAAFVTWLYSIARNRLTDHYRASARTRDFQESEEVEATMAQESPREPHEVIVNAELAQRLKELIGDLPPPQREAFLLKEETGLSLQHIAEVTGVDRETVKSRLRYAMNKLRKGLTESDA